MSTDLYFITKYEIGCQALSICCCRTASTGMLEACNTIQVGANLKLGMGEESGSVQRLFDSVEGSPCQLSLWSVPVGVVRRLLSGPKIAAHLVIKHKNEQVSEIHGVCVEM